MINTCSDCLAVREYPDGHQITKCPRCESPNISYAESPSTQAERNDLLLKAIDGDAEAEVVAQRKWIARLREENAELRSKLAEAEVQAISANCQVVARTNMLNLLSKEKRTLEAEVAGLRGALEPFIPPDTPPQSTDEHARLEDADAFGRLYAYLEGINHVHTRYGIVYASAIYDLIEIARKALAAPAPAEADAYMPAPPRPSGSIEVKLEHTERGPAPATTERAEEPNANL